VDRVKIGYLKAALSKELRDRLVTVKLPEKFKDYCDEVRHVADNMQEMEEINRRAARFNKHHPRVVDQQTDAMEWEPTQTTTVSASRSTSRSSQQGPRAKWVDKEEIDRRRESGDCLRCGKPGHRIKDCKLRPAQRPSAPARDSKKTYVAAVRKTPAATIEEVSGEESASEAEN
jgi:hypothetical protein